MAENEKCSAVWINENLSVDPKCDEESPDSQKLVDRWNAVLDRCGSKDDVQKKVTAKNQNNLACAFIWVYGTAGLSSANTFFNAALEVANKQSKADQIKIIKRNLQIWERMDKVVPPGPVDTTAGMEIDRPGTMIGRENPCNLQTISD